MVLTLLVLHLAGYTGGRRNLILADFILKEENLTQRSVVYCVDNGVHFIDFSDPDNGIEVKSKPMGGKDSSKYIYWSELLDAYNSGLSILVYQHFPRRVRDCFIEQTKSEIQMRLGVDVVHWFRTPQVVYFLVPQEEHIERVHMSIEKVVESWSIRGQILVG
jgi:hypothetical protein